MPITTGSQLLQHIVQGGNVSLNDSGQVQQQSGLAKFFQGLADIFCGLTASGRAGIAERNARLEEAMADLIRRDELLPNLTSGPLPPPGEGARASINKALVNLFVDQALHEGDVPETMWATTKKVVQALMQENPDLLASTDSAGLKSFAREMVGKIMADPELRSGMNQGYSKGPEGMEVFTVFISDTIRSSFGDVLRKGTMNPQTGICDSFSLDATRGTPPTINGVCLDPGAGQRTADEYNQQLINTVPLPARPFVSLLTSQIGINGALIALVGDKNGTNPKINSERTMGMQPEKFLYGGEEYKYTVTTYPDRVDVHLSFQTKGIFVDPELTQRGVRVGADDFSVTVSVPLGQFPVPEGTVPDFTVHSLTRQPFTAYGG